MIGRRGGERMIISGRPAFEAVQALRAESDAVMIGIGTVLIDDPQLTVRLPGLSRRSPIRVIVDAVARTPPGAKLFESKSVPLIVVVGPDAPEENKAVLKVKGARILEVAAASGGVDLGQTLVALAADGVNRVLVEGGSEVASTIVTDDLADEVILIRAPVVVGADGVRAFRNTALSAIERSPRYRQVESAVLGEDQMRRYVRTG
jgi:diaminohydroxyphosphoribosylaminopyrimidine deaminase/5-amino-6-(5-phosphoribosylamino)uracil reductase